MQKKGSKLGERGQGSYRQLYCSALGYDFGSVTYYMTRLIIIYFLLPGQLTHLDVLTELIGITKEWTDLATTLRIPEHEIDEIECSHSQDVKRCLRKMVDKWLKLQPGQVSWTTLCQALRHPLVSRPDIAEKIEHKHCVRN